MLCIKQTQDTEKLTFRESTVHEANNGQLCVHVMSSRNLLCMKQTTTSYVYTL